MSKLLALLRRHREAVVYLIFGALTTAVNYAVYLPLYNLLHLSASFSSAVSWAVAVIFAFLTNKPFVFQSKDWRWKTVAPEFAKFVLCRVGSGLAEIGILLITVDILGFNGNIWKLLVSVLVVILNYLASKLLVFRKN